VLPCTPPVQTKKLLKKPMAMVGDIERKKGPARRKANNDA
jgi:hypothetical protein